MNRIILKNVKTFKGHEGEPCRQGNLYMDSKKIGWFSEDSWGGPMQFHISDSKNEQEFYNRTKHYKVVFHGIELKGTELFIAKLFE